MDSSPILVTKIFKMFEKCPKINRGCSFCGKSRFSGKEKLYCGAANTTAEVDKLPDCWKYMSKSQKKKFKSII